MYIYIYISNIPIKKFSKEKKTKIKASHKTVPSLCMYVCVYMWLLQFFLLIVLLSRFQKPESKGEKKLVGSLNFLLLNSILRRVHIT